MSFGDERFDREPVLDDALTITVRGDIAELLRAMCEHFRQNVDAVGSLAVMALAQRAGFATRADEVPS